MSSFLAQCSAASTTSTSLRHDRRRPTDAVDVRIGHYRVRDKGTGREIVHVARTPAEAVAILQPLLVAAELTRIKQFLDGK